MVVLSFLSFFFPLMDTLLWNSLLCISYATWRWCCAVPHQAKYKWSTVRNSVTIVEHWSWNTAVNSCKANRHKISLKLRQKLVGQWKKNPEKHFFLQLYIALWMILYLLLQSWRCRLSNMIERIFSVPHKFLGHVVFVPNLYLWQLEPLWHFSDQLFTATDGSSQYLSHFLSLPMAHAVQGLTLSWSLLVFLFFHHEFLLPEAFGLQFVAGGHFPDLVLGLWAFVLHSGLEILYPLPQSMCFVSACGMSSAR